MCANLNDLHFSRNRLSAMPKFNKQLCGEADQEAKRQKDLQPQMQENNLNKNNLHNEKEIGIQYVSLPILE